MDGRFVAGLSGSERVENSLSAMGKLDSKSQSFAHLDEKGARAGIVLW